MVPLLGLPLYRESYTPMRFSTRWMNQMNSGRRKTADTCRIQCREARAG